MWAFLPPLHSFVKKNNNNKTEHIRRTRLTLLTLLTAFWTGMCSRTRRWILSEMLFRWVTCRMGREIDYSTPVVDKCLKTRYVISYLVMHVSCCSSLDFHGILLEKYYNVLYTGANWRTERALCVQPYSRTFKRTYFAKNLPHVPVIYNNRASNLLVIKLDNSAHGQMSLLSSLLHSLQIFQCLHCKVQAVPSLPAFYLLSLSLFFFFFF